MRDSMSGGGQFQRAEHLEYDPSLAKKYAQYFVP